MALYSYTPNPVTDVPNWVDYMYLATCGSYAPQLLTAAAYGGFLTRLFAGEAYGLSGQTQCTGLLLK